VPDREQVSMEARPADARVRDTHPDRVRELRGSGVTVIAERARGDPPHRRVLPANLLALQRAAGNQAIATWLQRDGPKAATTSAAKTISDKQIEQIVVDVDQIQQELVRIEERAVTMTNISLYYMTWLDCVNTVVEKERKAMEAVPPDLAMTILLGAFSLLAGPMAGKLAGVIGKRLAEIGTGVEATIRKKAIEIAASGAPRAVTPSQEEIAAVVIAVKGKLQAKWKSIEEDAGKADLSAVLPKPTGAAPETLDGIVETMKQSGRVASRKAVENTANMLPAQLISLSQALDPEKVPRDVIQAKIRRELRTLIDVAKAQANSENKTFRINAWGSTGVAILRYKGVSIVASRKATYTFVRWLPPDIVEAQGGADKFPLFDVDAHRGSGVGPFEGVFIGFLPPPPALAEQYMAMINEYGRPRTAIVQDVGTETHFVRWVPEDEAGYENARAGGAAKSFGYGQVKGVKPLDTPTVR
jgi:hypothetical protein